MAQFNNTLSLSRVIIKEGNQNRYACISFYSASMGTHTEVQNFNLTVNIPKELELVKGGFPNAFRRYFVPLVDPNSYEENPNNLDFTTTETLIGDQLFIQGVRPEPATQDGYLGCLWFKLPENFAAGDEFVISIDTDDGAFTYDPNGLGRIVNAAEIAYTKNHIVNGKITITE